jgi:hypothetical protein
MKYVAKINTVAGVKRFAQPQVPTKKDLCPVGAKQPFSPIRHSFQSASTTMSQHRNVMKLGTGQLMTIL